MRDYIKRFGYSPVERAIARIIMATEIYRDCRDLRARAEKIRKFQHDPDRFSTVADSIARIREQYDKIFALVGTPDEWGNSCKNPQAVIAEAIIAVVETYGSAYGDLLFRIRDAKSLVNLCTHGLTDQQRKIFADWHNYL
ncbi:MAG: hypothetical protein HY617_01235 [Candidatus Sungbacteria bacterium]|nr:hypothetical protein [Candidatus Sungbacteria bacterium]